MYWSVATLDMINKGGISKEEAFKLRPEKWEYPVMPCEM